ncbi:MAG: hypothetical protein MJB57_07585 [Gemmatimonadetes bacterium]|nr:hypothetical protein [Gemmatimonadota bacterium]
MSTAARRGMLAILIAIVFSIAPVSLSSEGVYVNQACASGACIEMWGGDCDGARDMAKIS